MRTNVLLEWWRIQSKKNNKEDEILIIQDIQVKQLRLDNEDHRNTICSFAIFHNTHLQMTANFWLKNQKSKSIGK